MPKWHVLGWCVPNPFIWKAQCFSHIHCFPWSYSQCKIHIFALSSMTGLEWNGDQPETQKEP